VSKPSDCPTGALRGAAAERKNEKTERANAHLKEELSAARSTLEHVTFELESLRAARRPKKIPKAATVRRSKDDFVRILFGDMHGCRMSRPAIAALLADLKALDPDEIVLGGDMMECGGFLAAHHVMGYVHEVEESYEEDIETTNAFFDRLQETVPRSGIEYLAGNHEARIERWIMTQKLRHARDAEFLRRTLDTEAVLHLQARGIPYHRRSLTHDNLRVPGWIKRGNLFITHELGSGKNAGSRAVVEAGGNVVFFHTHRRSEGIMSSPAHGSVMAWNPGCLCRRQPLWKHSHPSGWTHGYLVQFVTRSGNFLMHNILIDEGVSMLTPFLNHKK
jgi:hypothetical protein